MTALSKNPTRPVRALAGFGFANLAGCNPNLSASPPAVQMVSRRFGLSLPLAATVAGLAGLGFQDARS